MTRAALGVTVGKFYPFHRGHDRLLRAAKAQVERLVVLVGERPGQALSGALRAGWIREEHPDVEVVVTPEDIPEAPEPWARRALEVLGGRRPDLAFTSEDYGAPWAAAMGAVHVAIDPARGAVPISGTALRADLGRHWAQLTPPAKAHLCRRVVVLGVESSGTTTLAQDLAAHYRTAWVPEFGRHYWEGRRQTPGAEAWEPSEFHTIARGQAAFEDALARRAERVLVCDTDPLATHVWRRRYLGSYDPALGAFAAERAYDLHVLTAPDVPFVQDGTRDGEHVREDMHRWFLETLAAAGRRTLVVTGAREARLAAACEAIDPLLRFPPLAAP